LKAVFGLGNPGKRYRKTRHNLGFLVIDHYLKRLRPSSSLRELLYPNKRYGHQSRARLRGRRVDQALVYRVEEDLLLVKPLTYMNRSGLAVREIAERFKLKLENCLIVHDDFDIPLGKLRARARGGPGGHKGLGSIIAELGTAQVPRLRIGIGREDLYPKDGHRQGELLVPVVWVTDYVLGRFTPEELAVLERVLERAVEAIDLFYEGGIEQVMEEVNRKDL